MIRSRKKLSSCAAGALAISLLIPAIGSAKGKPAASPYRFAWELDAPILLGAAALWIGPSLANRGNPPLSCNPCDKSGINALDRMAIGNYSRPWDVSGDVLAAVIPALAAIGGVAHIGKYGFRGWGEDLLLVAQAMALSGMLNQVVRHAVDRPRPFMYEKDARPELRNNPESALSFYSGHTSTVFAAAATYSYSYFLRHPESWSRWLVGAGSLAAASVMPLSRVLAGEHFITDVLTGAVVGTAIGILVPALHRVPLQLRLSVAARNSGAYAGLSGQF